MGNRNLRSGMTGPDVRAVQSALNVWGADPPLKVDGDFRGRTDTAVRKFQEEYDLDVDGVVGKQTRTALFPIGVATVTLYGMRLKLPEFNPTRPRRSPSFGLPNLSLDPPPRPVISGAFSPLYEPTRFSRLFTPLPAPSGPNLNFVVPPARTAAPWRPFGFVYDHVELQPGGQTTFAFGGQRQDVFVLTMQNVYLRGPDSGAHVEADLGVSIGTPVTDPNGRWTVNPFIQLTDVDRFGALGKFHYWQPYAQAGFQFVGLGNPQPALTANLFPVNLGFDINDVLTVTAAGGLALTMDLQTGRVQAGMQFSAGLTLKLGKAN